MEPRYLKNFYITNSWVKRTILFTPAMVKYMKKNLEIRKPGYREHIFTSPLVLRYIEVPLYENHRTYFCGRAAESAHHLHSLRFLTVDWDEF